MPTGLGSCGTGAKNARLCLSTADCAGDTTYPKCCSCGKVGGVQNPVYLCSASAAPLVGCVCMP